MARIPRLQTVLQLLKVLGQGRHFDIIKSVLWLLEMASALKDWKDSKFTRSVVL